MSGGLISLFLLFHTITIDYLAQACNCEKFTYRPYMERTKFLVRLPDSTKLNSLALIGTHLSSSCNAEAEEFRTQDLNIEQQLKYGVRVFDVSVRLHPDLFKIELSYVPLNPDFREILYDFDKFLDHNPGEFVIVIIRQEYKVKTNVMEEYCGLLDYYFDNVWGGWRMVKNWKLSDPIGMYRNQILLASSDPSFSGCSFNIKTKCNIRNINTLHTKRTISDNLLKIFNIKQAVSVKNYCAKKLKCFINNLSFIDDGYDRRVIARDGGYQIGDHCIKPINLQMIDNFINPHCELIIIMADYPPQELMDKVNDSNFKNSSWRSGWE